MFVYLKVNVCIPKSKCLYIKYIQRERDDIFSNHFEKKNELLNSKISP